MGKIVVRQNVSLDGVVQDPTGEEGFPRGGWFVQVDDKDREAGEVELDEALRAEALLLGRKAPSGTTRRSSRAMWWMRFRSSSSGWTARSSSTPAVGSCER